MTLDDFIEELIELRAKSGGARIATVRVNVTHYVDFESPAITRGGGIPVDRMVDRVIYADGYVLITDGTR